MIKVILLSSLLFGCATNYMKNLSREEYLGITTKTYSDVKKEDLIKHAEEVIRLIDPDDVIFYHTQNGFVAHRSFFAYVVLAASVGKDVWEFNIVEGDNNNLTASLKISTTASTTSATPTTGGDFSSNTATSGTPADTNVPYVVFWERLDNLLGRASYWPHCIDIRSRQKSGEFISTSSELCELTDDLVPLNLPQNEINRIASLFNSSLNQTSFIQSLNRRRVDAGMSEISIKKD